MITQKDFYAGRHIREGLQEKLVLSPLPLSTQEQPLDVANSIKEKNSIYLDISHGSIHTAIEFLGIITTIIFLSFMSIWIFIASLSGFQFNEGDFFTLKLLFGIFMFGETIIIYGIWKNHRYLKKYPLMRFNRQRREVAVPFGKKNRFITVPWEELYVWVETDHVASDTIKASNSIMRFTIASLDKKENFLSGFKSVAGGDETTCIMLWECIRHFMEEGPEACPYSGQYDNLEEYIRDRKHFKEQVLTPWEYKKLKMADWLQWRYFAYWFEEWQQKRIIKKIPSEIQAWSKPIPEDQWVKPSAKLIEAQKRTQAYYNQGGKFGGKDMPYSGL